MGNRNSQAFWGFRHHLPELYQRQRITEMLDRDRAATASSGQTAVCLETVIGDMTIVDLHDKIKQSLDRDRAPTASSGQTAVCLETVRVDMSIVDASQD